MTTYKLNSKLQAGDIITIRYPLYKHYAIVSDKKSNFQGACYPNLISLSNRTGTVREEPWHKVVNNNVVEKSHINGSDDPQLVLKRARKCESIKIKYNLLRFNCEHFVRYVHGLPIESIQVKKTVSGAAFGIATCMLLPKVTAMRVVLFATTGAIASLKGSLNKI